MTIDTHTTQPSQIPWKRIGRVVGGVSAAAAFAYGALITAFIGSVITSGCFFTCSDPNPVGGFPILMSAAAMAGAAVTALAWAVSGRRLWPLTKTVGGVVTGLGVIGALVATVGMT
jgi:hypothetical protein